MKATQFLVRQHEESPTLENFLADRPRAETIRLVKERDRINRRKDGGDYWI
ncbi:MAG: hypothetical protein ABIA59_11900 [Candidatus Latescibacterota bacterium]